MRIFLQESAEKLIIFKTDGEEQVLQNILE